MDSQGSESERSAENADRLQKVLARAGVASRRASEELIKQGRVTVNGHTVRELGLKVSAGDIVAVDGKPLKPQARKVYIMLNKPRGFVTTAADDFGRRTVLDLVPARERLFPVGRLDADSEGLLLLTNDGDLANLLTHPRYGFEKEYHALVDQDLTDREIRQLREGILLEGRKTAPGVVDRMRNTPEGLWLRIIIHEGRNRQIRRMLATLGRRVLRLIRVRVGPLRLGELRLGHFRPLTPDEVAALLRAPKSS